MDLTVGITTFEHRFHTYYIELIKKIKSIAPNIEVIVAINGEHTKDFNESYRKNILNSSLEYNNVYPIFFPKFRGLSKLWNTIVIHSSNEYVLLLNDDLTINDTNFIKNIYDKVLELQTSFKLNNNWSHVLLKKEEIDQCGYFDERLLGIGEEDGDFEWRYNSYYNKDFISININGIINHTDMTHNPANIKAISQGKYSKFNQDMMYHKIYEVDEQNGQRHGACPYKLRISEPLLKQYPYELFFKENYNNL